MPEPTSINDFRSQDLTDAPGADLSFDDLFATPGETSNPQPPQAAATEQTPPASQATPAPPTPDEVFLRTQSSVYKTREEAERGFSQKDAAIERLRQFAIEKTGFDPLTNKQVNQSLQPPQPPAAPAQSKSYMENPKAYWDELYDSASKNDYNRYAQAQAQYVRELQEQTLAPFVPLIQDVARQKAISTLSHENKDFSTWVGSDNYRSFLDTAPALRQAIEYAENTPQAYTQLTELYRIGYLADQGRRLPDIIKAQSQAQPAAPPAQPLTSSGTSTLTPPAPASYGNTREEMLRSTEGRKAIIDQFERGGNLDRDLTSFR